MGAMPAERITHAAELDLPPEVADVFAELTPAGRQQFTSEIMQAFVAARNTDDLRPLQDVIQAWYRTLLARRSPDYEAALEWAASGEEGAPLDVEAVRARFAS